MDPLMKEEKALRASRQKWSRFLIITTGVQLLAALLLAIFAHMAYFETQYSNEMADDFKHNWQ